MIAGATAVPSISPTVQMATLITKNGRAEDRAVKPDPSPRKRPAPAKAVCQLAAQPIDQRADPEQPVGGGRPWTREAKRAGFRTGR
jgi:hypothetical protein